MPSKLLAYAALAEHQTKQITGSRESWTDFLTTAGRLYKYPFEEQLMIYAQRPDATACAPLEMWNKPMNRYVRKGSKGIALIDTTGDKPRIRYVFDVADTENGWHDRSYRPYIWELKPEHEAAVMQSLSDTHSTGNAYENIGDMIFGLAHELSARYYEDNKSDIGYSTEGSFLEDFDELNVSVAYREALTVSAAYSIMKRCGIDTEDYISDEDFQPIFDFNTLESANALGNGVSTVSEEILREIEVVIKKHDRERSNSHERNDIQPERGLPDTRPGIDGSGRSFGQIRNDAEELSAETPPDSALSPEPARTVVFPLFGNRADGEPEIVADDRPDEPIAGRGNDYQRTDTQLNDSERETPTVTDWSQATLAARPSIPYGVSASDDAITDDEINSFLATGSGISNGKYRIYSFFSA